MSNTHHSPKSQCKKPLPYFLFVMGPTGVGKSSWALEFGKSLMQSPLQKEINYKVEVINCDSVQIYKKLKIGSALPQEKDMKSLPHHLYAYTGPEQKRFTVAQYRKDFFELVKKRSLVNKPFQQLIFFVVGGTGFYFQALEKGLYKAGHISSKLQEHLKEKAREKGFQGLHQELQKLDPKTGTRIHPNDHYRILRALELIYTEKKPLSQIQDEKSLEDQAFPYPFNKILLDVSFQSRKKILKDRIEKMFRRGFVQEVQHLLKEGLKNWSPLFSVGYKEVSHFLHEHSSLPNPTEKKELIEKILTAHMHLGKKQRTWFKKEKSTLCFLLPEEKEKAEKYVLQNMKKHLHLA